MGYAKPYYISPAFAFTAYPNRDSTPFKEFYDIPEAETLIRGTLRYQGFPEFIKALVQLGWLETSEKVWLKEGLTWAQVMQNTLGTNDANERYVFFFFFFFHPRWFILWPPAVFFFPVRWSPASKRSVTSLVCLKVKGSSQGCDGLDCSHLSLSNLVLETSWTPSVLNSKSWWNTIKENVTSSCFNTNSSLNGRMELRFVGNSFFFSSFLVRR